MLCHTRLDMTDHKALSALALENEAPLWLLGSKFEEPQPKCGSHIKSDKMAHNIF